MSTPKKHKSSTPHPTDPDQETREEFKALAGETPEPPAEEPPLEPAPAPVAAPAPTPAPAPPPTVPVPDTSPDRLARLEAAVTTLAESISALVRMNPALTGMTDEQKRALRQPVGSPQPGAPPIPPAHALMGDKTPAVVEWYRRYWPEEFEERYRGRKTHLTAQRVAKEGESGMKVTQGFVVDDPEAFKTQVEQLGEKTNLPRHLIDPNNPIVL